jgi:hypothetical protein
MFPRMQTIRAIMQWTNAAKRSWLAEYRAATR